MNANDPAFHFTEEDNNVRRGMTIRTYIATAAMNGFLSNPAYTISREEIAFYAVKAADALIASLNSIPTP